MQIRVTCPECGKSFQIPSRFAGRDGECSNCSAVFHIPEQADQVPDAEMRRESGTVPQTPPLSDAPQPVAPQVPAPQRDAGVTEEIPIYSIDLSGSSGDFDLPAAADADDSRHADGSHLDRKRPASEDQPVAAAANNSAELVFDITEADLLPDDDDASDDGASVLERTLDTESGGADSDSASGDIVLTRGNGSRRTAGSGEIPQSRRRRRSRNDDSDESGSAEIAAPPKRSRRRRPVGKHPNDDHTSDPAIAAINDEDDSEAGREAPAVPVLRRRISEQEPARRKSHVASDSTDSGEATDRRQPQKSNPRQLLIASGIGAVLLAGAGLYSQFSGPSTPTLPVLEGNQSVVIDNTPAGEAVQSGEAEGTVTEAAPPRSSQVAATAAGKNGQQPGTADSLAVSAPVPQFPELPAPKASAVDGVSYYEIELSSVTANSGPGARMRLILYLPPGEHPAGSLSCVLVAPAGTSLLEGAECFDDAYRAETLPYVEAGVAVVGYSLDGAMPFDLPTDAELNAAYRQFRAAQAGLVNARNALEFVLARVPQVAPDRIFTAGHSSAGTLSLLFAAHEPRLAGSIAFAPCTDPEKRLAGFIGNPAVQRVLPGAAEFARFESPVHKADRISCPVFLFHAEDDSNVPVAESRAFAEQLSTAGNSPTLKVVASGDHYDSMVDQGLPAAIDWLRQQADGR